MARKTLKPEATINLAVNGHRLTGERWNGAWVLSCRSWPELAERHAGCADASSCIESFERRARGEPEPPPPVTAELIAHTNPPVVVFRTRGGA